MKLYAFLRRAGVVAVIGAISSVSSVYAGAPLVKWGAETSGFIADVNTGSGQNNATVKFDGGAGSSFSSFLVDDAVELDFNGNGPHDRGTAQAEATLTSGIAPILRAKSVLTGNTSGLSGVLGAAGVAGGRAAQLYRYTGGSALQVTFTLTATIRDPSIAQYGDLTWADANVSLWEPESFEFFDIGSLFEFGATPITLAGGENAVDTSTLFLTDDTGGLQDSLQVVFNAAVSPGDEFYVLNELGTSARMGDRAADAFSTLTTAFTSGNVIVVPEPATLGLLALSALLLVGRHRRR